MSTKVVPLSEVGFDERYSPRLHLSPKHVESMRDALLASEKKQMPPVTVVLWTAKGKYKYLCLDGRHRMAAYTAAGRDQIPISQQNIPQSRWYQFAVEVNMGHGLRMSHADIRNIISRFDNDGLPDAEQATILQMPITALQKFRAPDVLERTPVTGSGPSTAVLDRPLKKIGNPARRTAPEPEALDVPGATDAIEGYIDELLAAVRLMNGKPPAKLARKLRELMKAIEKIV